jgi:hypothetical protein
MNACTAPPRQDVFPFRRPFCPPSHAALLALEPSSSPSARTSEPNFSPRLKTSEVPQYLRASRVCSDQIEWDQTLDSLICRAILRRTGPHFAGLLGRVSHADKPDGLASSIVLRVADRTRTDSQARCSGWPCRRRRGPLRQRMQKHALTCSHPV